MIRRVLFPLSGFLFLTLLTACGPKDAADLGTPATSHASPPIKSQTGAKEDGALFDPDKGLYLPTSTRQLMGITTASVQGKTFRAERTMKFQVFREANEAPLPGMSYRAGYAYASTILTNPKHGLDPGQTGEVLEEPISRRATTAKFFQSNPLSNSNQTEFLIEIIDLQHQFSMNEFCTVRWQMASVAVSAVAPDSSLLKTTEGDFVYLLKGDRFVRTKVKPGATGEGYTEITEGASAGDVIVTNAVQTLWLTELKLKTGGTEP